MWEACTKNGQWWERHGGVGGALLGLCLLLGIRRRLTMLPVPQTNSVTESNPYEYLHLRICTIFQELKSLYSWVRGWFLVLWYCPASPQPNSSLSIWSAQKVRLVQWYFIGSQSGCSFFLDSWFSLSDTPPLSLKQMPHFQDRIWFLCSQICFLCFMYSSRKLLPCPEKIQRRNKQSNTKI